MIIGWMISISLVVIGVLMFFGKGIFLLAGYNTASREEKARYDEKLLGRICGSGIGLFGLGMCVYNYFEFQLPGALGWIVPLVMTAAIVGMVVLANTVCRRF